MKIILVSLLLFLITGEISAQQNQIKEFKQRAIEHMQAGRYGEAIDLLNKYISENAREAEGYNLRAIAYENRSQYQNAVLDYRRAVALEPSNKEYQNNLNRVIDVWYKQLKDKIEGHQREIAIDPNNAYNYLEIGKSYRWMEEWDKAEEWYDKYLERDQNASPDEIIRYTEILAKTGHIKKGERILREYVDRYPDDWRLWSRFGYFLLWLANYREAETAFQTALDFKPFFKEAQDGLDIVKKEAYVTQEDPRSFEQVYPIDRYYSLLRSNPDDDDARFKLVEELIKADRIEEAYQQLQRLAVRHQGEEKFDELWNYVENYRNETYQEKIAAYQSRLESNPSDLDAVKKLAQYHEYLQEYDQALEVLENYMSANPDVKDPDLRFEYARINAWARYYDKAIQVMDDLLTDYPNNLQYQLFRAQLSIWTTQDLDMARGYLNNILSADSSNIDGLIAMSSLELHDNNFDEARRLAAKAKGIDPNNDEVVKLEQNIEFQELRYQEEQLFTILNQGRELAMDRDFEGALPYYEDYLSKAEPNNLILKEYGDVLFGAGRLQEAKDVYERVLNDGYFYEAALQNAKVTYAMDDSLEAVKLFRDLVKEEPYEFEPKLYLGDSYAKADMYDSARTVYNELLERDDLDSTEISMIQQRKGWLPVTGLSAIFDTFPNYIGFAPSASFYSDDLSFRFMQAGGRLELGITYWLSGGISFSRTHMTASEASLDSATLANYYFVGDNDFTTFKGHIFLRFIKNAVIGVNFGQVNVGGAETRDETEAFFNYEKKDTIKVNFQYLNTDGAMVLYSPYLIDNRLYTTYYRFDGYYNHKRGMHFSGYFSYLKNTDGNEGNDFQLRIGRKFQPDLIVGYEYFYSNYKYDVDLYYSPTNFESHALFLDSYLEDQEDLQVTMGGKIGFVPASDFLLLSAYVNASWKLSPTLSLDGRVSVGSTSRDSASYKYVSGQISAYWNIY